ncbi:hypothetical protein EJB05_01790, partial [Eragrostis curvula]
MSDRADWCDVNLRHFIEIMKNEIEDGNRPLGQYTRTAWKNVAAKLRNKLDNLKKEYIVFMELKNSATGLGWNEANQTIDCSDEWWDEHFAKCNNPEKGIKCKHMKFKKKRFMLPGPMPHPGDISSDQSSDEDVVELAALKKAKSGKKKRKESSNATEEKDKKSPFFRLYKNTCMKIETAADKISSSVSASLAPPRNEVPTIKEDIQTVKEFGVQEKT